MTTDKEQDTLPVNLNREEQMAEIMCNDCGRIRELQNRHPDEITVENVSRRDIVQGVVICARCEARTVFELTGNTLTFAPKRLFEADVDDEVAENAKEMFSEALRCFYGTSYRGAIAMCRSAIAEGILGKQIGKRRDSLDVLIKEAVSQKVLDSTDETKADYARLLGRGVVHRMLSVSGTEAMITIQSTAELLNTIARQ